MEHRRTVTGKRFLSALLAAAMVLVLTVPARASEPVGPETTVSETAGPENAASETAAGENLSPACLVQTLIDTLPDAVTAENAEAVNAVRIPEGTTEAEQTVRAAAEGCTHEVVNGNQCEGCGKYAQASVEANGTTKYFFASADDSPVDMAEVWQYACEAYDASTGMPVEIHPASAVSGPLVLDNGAKLLLYEFGRGLSASLTGPVVRVTDGELTLGPGTSIINETGTGVEVSGAGTFILDEGMVTAKETCVQVSGGSFVMKAGTLESTGNSCALKVDDASAQVTINGGELSGTDSAVLLTADAGVAIKGGSIGGLKADVPLTKMKLSGGTFDRVEAAAGEAADTFLEAGYAYYGADGAKVTGTGSSLTGPLSVVKDSAHSIGSLDLHDKDSDQGDLDTDGYHWDAAAKTLTLKDCTVVGDVILPCGEDVSVKVLVQGDSYIGGAVQFKSTNPWGGNLPFDVTFGPAVDGEAGTLTVAGKLGGTHNNSKLTIASGISVTALGSVEAAGDGGVGGTLTVNGTLNAAGSSNPAVTTGNVVINDGGRLDVSGTKGVFVGGFYETGVFSVEDAFVMNGGTFHGSCSDYNVLLSANPNTLTGDVWKTVFSFPPDSNYIPDGYSVQMAKDEYNGVAAIAPDGTSEAVLLSYTGLGGEMTLKFREKSREAGVQEVSVDGKAGTIDGNIITVVLPVEVQSLPAAGDIQITTKHSKAAVSALTDSDGGRTWNFTVTAEDGVTTQDYTIRVILLTPVASVAVNGATKTFGWAEGSEYEIPAKALRAAWEYAAEAAAPATITLLDHVTLDGGSQEADGLTVPAGSDITLEGGSYTLSGNQVSMIRVEGGSFTLASGNVENANAAGGRCITVVSGSAAVKGGRVEAASAAMMVIESGSLEVTDGTILGNTCVQAAGNGTVDISGGTLTCTGSSAQSEQAVWVYADSEVSVSGGEITGPSGVLVSQNGMLNVSGTAKIKGLSSSAMNSGIFTTSPSGTVNITGGEVSGERGISAAGGTITISSDGTVNGENYGILAQNSTIEINGGTVNGKYGIYAWTGSDVSVNGGAVNSPTNSGLYVYGGSVSVTGGTFGGNNGLYVNQGSAVLSGGTFTGNTAAVRNVNGTVKELLDTDFAYFTGTTISSDTEVTDDTILNGDRLAAADGYGTVTVAQVPLAAVSQPQDQKLTYGYQSGPELSFVVRAAEPGSTVTYQWYKDGNAIPGANSAAYTVPAGLEADTYVYSCVATCGLYSITSEAAEVAVAAKALTVAAKNQTITYGGDIGTDISQVTVTGLVAGDTLESVTLTADTTDVPGGKLTPSAAVIKNGSADAKDNYQITYTDGGLTISRKGIPVPAASPDLTYSGRTQTGVAAGAGYTITGNEAVNAGSYQAIAAVDGNHIWELPGGGTSTDDQTIPWSIDKKDLTVTLTAGGGTYNGRPFGAEMVLTGAVDGENVPVTLTYQGTGAAAYDSTTPPTDAGTYTVTASVPDSNYRMDDVTEAFTIDTASIADAEIVVNGSYVYNGTAQVPAVTVTLDGRTLAEGTDYDITAANNINAGTAAFTITGRGNYSGTKGGRTFFIEKKPLTVTITADGGVEGQEIAPATAVLDQSGLVTGETAPAVTLTYTGTACDGTAVDSEETPGKAGTYTVTAAISDPGSNYTLMEPAAGVFIVKRPITVTIDSHSKTYGEPDPKLTYQVTGDLLQGIELNIELCRTAGEDVGRYSITVASDTAAKNPGYEIKVIDGTFTIEKRNTGNAPGTGKPVNTDGNGNAAPGKGTVAAPPTGENDRIGLWVMALALSVILLVAAPAVKQKKKKRPC